MDIESARLQNVDGGIKDLPPTVDLPHPTRKLYWITTEACNLKCGYCFYNSDLKQRLMAPQRALDEKLGLIDQIPRSFDEVVFTGGEALLDRNLPKLIEEVKKRGLKVDILTNGVLLTEEKSREFIDLGVDCISISLDSLDSEVNDQLRGESQNVIANIEALLTLKQKEMTVEIMTTVTQANLGSIRQLVDFCTERGLLLWLDPVEINSGVHKLKHLDLTKMSTVEKDRLQQEMAYWAKQMDNGSLIPYAEASMQLVNGDKPANISCAMGTDHFVLEPDGTLHPCFSRSDINYGNVYEGGLSQALENAANYEKQHQLQAAECVRLGCVCMTIVSDYNTTANHE